MTSEVHGRRAATDIASARKPERFYEPVFCRVTGQRAAGVLSVPDESSPGTDLRNEFGQGGRARRRVFQTRYRGAFTGHRPR